MLQGFLSPEKVNLFDSRLVWKIMFPFQTTSVKAFWVYPGAMGVRSCGGWYMDCLFCTGGGFPVKELHWCHVVHVYWSLELNAVDPKLCSWPLGGLMERGKSLREVHLWLGLSLTILVKSLVLTHKLRSDVSFVGTGVVNRVFNVKVTGGREWFSPVHRAMFMWLMSPAWRKVLSRDMRMLGSDRALYFP